MSNLMQVSTSFVQTNKHETKTPKFQHITPSNIETALADHGFGLVHLKSGRAKLQANADHQTTIARYRAANPLSISSGGRDLYMDLVFKVPHLYGALQAFVGTFRQVCSNGLTVGSKFVIGRVPHTGDAQTALNDLIPYLVATHDQLVDSIREFQGRDVTPSQVAEFVREIASQRLGQSENVINVQFTDLMRVRRSEDAGTDAFSVLNVVQENLMRYGLRYQTKSVDAQGREIVRNMTARPVTRTRNGETESVRSIDLNASLWDAATKILLAA